MKEGYSQQCLTLPNWTNAYPNAASRSCLSFHRAASFHIVVHSATPNSNASHPIAFASQMPIMYKVLPSIHLVSTVIPRDYGSLNPNPAIQLLYLSIVVAQSFCGSRALLNNMHSSRVAFSSLQTQQAYHRVISKDVSQ